MPEQHAETTISINLNGQTRAGRGTRLRFSLGVGPVEDGRATATSTFFFAVDLDDLPVHLPNPLPGGPMVTGTTQISETLVLSRENLVALRAWLDAQLPARTRG